MVEDWLGRRVKLTVVSIKEHGAYLGADRTAGPDARVLLPKKQVPEGTAEGDALTVFIYRDSSDRLIATEHDPLLHLHETALLRVKETTKIGAFLDWGLERDLLLPFHEQTRRVKAGEEVLAALYVDKSGRLAATMKVYPYLRTDSPYTKGDHVTGRVYQFAENFGTFVAVDDMYSAMVPKREFVKAVPGDVLEFRVTEVRPDGKLDLSARDAAYKEIAEDSENVFAVIREDYGGELPFDDKASPERIREVFGLSKAAFKRAVGHLYRQRMVLIEDGKIIARE